MDQSHSDTQYFLRRADEELVAAERASDPRARQSHLDLAERYATAARAVAAKPRLKLVETDPAPIAPAQLLQPEIRSLP